MTTVLRIEACRFHFYSDQGGNAANIHVRHGNHECKFWLSPIGVARNKGIPPHELRQLEHLIFENQEMFMEKYNEYFNS